MTKLKPQTFACPVCVNIFVLDNYRLKKLINNRKHGKALKGPYCSKSCAALACNNPGTRLSTEIKMEYEDDNKNTNIN